MRESQSKRILNVEKRLIFGSLLLCICGLAADLAAKDYKGAELRTREAYLYGRFEVRYKSAAGDGLVSTFFTYHEIQSSSEWNEIDIEIHGRYPDDIQLTTITPNQISHLRHQYLPFNPHTDFHTYTIEWTPDYVVWFVDGEEVYRQTEEHIATLNRPQKIMMNIWPPAYKNWVGTLDDRSLPRFAVYDYVSYASYTPGSGDVGTDNNFTLQWKDSFDNWDPERWEKATHTFPGNNCDFVPENVVYRDGYMILCLTKPGSLGYQDAEPPAVLWARAEGDDIVLRFSEEVTPETAEKTSNYVLSGVSILSATLGNDRRTVRLRTSGLNPSESYNLFYLGVRDDPPGNNTVLGQSVPVIMSRPLTFPLKINVGGDRYLDFLPDQEFTPQNEYGYQDGTSAVTDAPIQGTVLDPVFQSERHGLAVYRVRVPNGQYRVTLWIAENYFTQANKRYFDIYVEGEQIVHRLDLFQVSGIHSAYSLIVNPVAVNDRQLDLHFSAGLDEPVLNGLLVEEIATEVKESSKKLPKKFGLLNFPNPFRETTAIEYYLPVEAFVSIAVYDLLGNEVARLFSDTRKAGVHKIFWKADVPAGIYFCRLEAKSGREQMHRTQKLMVLK